MPEDIQTKIGIVDLNEDENYGQFEITPLDQGFGMTLGNALRRVLLSSLPGAAITSIKIDGVLHELSVIEGVLEDVTEIVLNLKGVHVRKFTEEPVRVTLEAKGPKDLLAGDLELDTDIEIVNPDHHIATLNEDAHLIMEVLFENGKGYEMAEEGRQRRAELDKKHRREEQQARKEKGENPLPVGEGLDDPTKTIGEIAIDALFAPVEVVNFQIDPARVGGSHEYDKLGLEVKTNGAQSPQEVVAKGAEILMDYLDLFLDLPDLKLVDEVEEEEEEDQVLNTKIEDIYLNLRAYNCLNRAGVETVGDIIEHTREELLEIKNFGKKSLEDVEEKIHGLGLNFKGEEPLDFEDE